MSGVQRVKAEELRELDAEELDGRLKGARRELYELRFKLAVGQLDDHRQIRKVRKDIARILTAVHQRRLEGVPAGVGVGAEVGAARPEPPGEPRAEEPPENVEAADEESAASEEAE